MKLSDFVCFDALIAQLEADDRDGAIRELVNALGDAGKFGKKQVDSIAEAVIKRENEASTGIGRGVAVPHAKCEGVKDIVAAVGCKSEGLDFSSLDKKPVYSVILLLSPEDNADKHLQAMETVVTNLHKEDFRKFLRQSTEAEQIVDLIKEADESPSF
jgi:mannitol/fructose-specific phosphotransferase system IIA component (Ntr-type)